MKHEGAVVAQLVRQNRLLKAMLGAMVVGLGALGLMASSAHDATAHFVEIDAERINIVTPEGKRELVLANRQRLPRVVSGGKEVGDDRHKPGIIFYNADGDENGGLIFDGAVGPDGKPDAGVHFSMDRYGGDQQLALGTYESGGSMESGLHVYDRGLAKDYGPLWDAYQQAPEGPEKERLKNAWISAGGRQTPRVFVGKTRGRSSAVILADDSGRPRIMMLVEPDGTPSLAFLDAEGNTVQELPARVPVAH